MHLLLSEISSNDPLVKWVLVFIGGATILFAVFRPSLRKKDPLARSPASRSLSQQQNVERQMENLLVELSEMQREMSAQLETRRQKLEMLIRDADDKIAALQRANSSAPPTEENGMTDAQRQAWTIPAEPRVSEPPGPALDPQHEQVYALADQGSATPEIARQLNRPRGEIELILALRARS